MNPRYLIVSGYFEKPNRGLAWFHSLWHQNLVKYAMPHPERLFIISGGNCSVPGGKGEWIVFAGDLGSTGTVLDRHKRHFMASCAATWMAGAWLAYLNECDFVYVEQDLLVFGPWVERLYKEMGQANAIFGKNALHGTSTSLFLVRHKFIPQFVYDYLHEGEEDSMSRIPEKKIGRLASRRPEDYAWNTFNYDTDRPFNTEDDVFAVQKLEPHELRVLELAGKLSTAGMPAHVHSFTNG